MWGASDGLDAQGGGGATANGFSSHPPAAQAPAVLPPQQSCAVEVHGLDASVSLVQIRQLFTQLGPVASIHAAVDGDAAQASAVVAFNTPAAAAQAVELVDGYPLGNSFLHVKLASGLGHHYITALGQLDPALVLAQQQQQQAAVAAAAAASRQPWNLPAAQQPHQEANGLASYQNGNGSSGQHTNGLHAAALEAELQHRLEKEYSQRLSLHDLQQHHEHHLQQHSGEMPDWQQQQEERERQQLASSAWQTAGTGSRSGSSWASLGAVSTDAPSSGLTGSQGTGPGAPVNGSAAGMHLPSSGKLMVRNLQLKVTSAEIRELFKPYGAVEECMKFPDARYAFVHFRLPSAAAAALVELNGQEVPGVSDEGGMQVEFREQQGAAGPNTPNAGAQAGGSAAAAAAASRNKLTAAGAAAGNGSAAADNGSAGVQRKVAMLAAKEAAAPEPLWGRPPKPGGQDGASHEPTTKLWLGAIDGAANPAVVKKVFSRFGTVYDIELQRATHEKGRSDQWGFVNFRRVEDAGRAFEALVGEVIPELTGHRKLKLQFRVPSGRKDGGRR